MLFTSRTVKFPPQAGDRAKGASSIRLRGFRDLHCKAYESLRPSAFGYKKQSEAGVMHPWPSGTISPKSKKLRRDCLNLSGFKSGISKEPSWISHLPQRNTKDFFPASVLLFLFGGGEGRGVGFLVQGRGSRRPSGDPCRRGPKGFRISCGVCGGCSRKTGT